MPYMLQVRIFAMSPSSSNYISLPYAPYPLSLVFEGLVLTFGEDCFISCFTYFGPGK